MKKGRVPFFIYLTAHSPSDKMFHAYWKRKDYEMKDNIVLIGMPGCGKSSLGVVLAKALGYRFMDSDLVIQEKEGRLLSEIIEQEGLTGFERIEEKINASIEASRTVIATGGSVIYGPAAMKHLHDIGSVVYLKLPLKEIEGRLGDLSQRGVAVRPGQTLGSLYEERVPLYEKYADITVDVYGLDIRNSVLEVIQRLA